MVIVPIGEVAIGNDIASGRKRSGISAVKIAIGSDAASEFGVNSRLDVSAVIGPQKAAKNVGPVYIYGVPKNRVNRLVCIIEQVDKLLRQGEVNLGTIAKIYRSAGV